jgi:hypothetical protein
MNALQCGIGVPSAGVEGEGGGGGARAYLGLDIDRKRGTTAAESQRAWCQRPRQMYEAFLVYCHDCDYAGNRAVRENGG